MKDPNTSSLRCPKCGEHLVRDDANDVLNCPAHGTVGTVGTFHQLAKAEISDILREIRESLDKAYDDDA
jgi:uncharacterized Zn finger protein (UPF0148 family)